MRTVCAVDTVDKKECDGQFLFRTLYIIFQLSSNWQTVLSMGADPTHLNFDKAKGILYVANYNGGNFAAYKINPDGSFGALRKLFHFPPHTVQATFLTQCSPIRTAPAAESIRADKTNLTPTPCTPSTSSCTWWTSARIKFGIIGSKTTFSRRRRRLSHRAVAVQGRGTHTVFAGLKKSLFSFLPQKSFYVLKTLDFTNIRA